MLVEEVEEVEMRGIQKEIQNPYDVIHTQQRKSYLSASLFFANTSAAISSEAYLYAGHLFPHAWQTYSIPPRTTATPLAPDGFLFFFALAAARCDRRTVDLDNGTTVPLSSSNGQPHRLHNLATSDLDKP